MGHSTAVAQSALSTKILSLFLMSMYMQVLPPWELGGAPLLTFCLLYSPKNKQALQSPSERSQQFSKAFSLDSKNRKRGVYVHWQRLIVYMIKLSVFQGLGIQCLFLFVHVGSRAEQQEAHGIVLPNGAAIVSNIKLDKAMIVGTPTP